MSKFPWSLNKYLNIISHDQTTPQDAEKPDSLLAVYSTLEEGGKVNEIYMLGQHWEQLEQSQITIDIYLPLLIHKGCLEPPRASLIFSLTSTISGAKQTEYTILTHISRDSHSPKAVWCGRVGTVRTTVSIEILMCCADLGSWKWTSNRLLQLRREFAGRVRGSRHTKVMRGRMDLREVFAGWHISNWSLTTKEYRFPSDVLIGYYEGHVQGA